MATYHMFFIQTDDSYVVGENVYPKWDIGPRTYKLPNAPDPSETERYFPVLGVVATVGPYSMLYIATHTKAVFEVAQGLPSYAGGGVNFGGAWVDFIVRSYERLGVHQGFAAGAAAKRILKARWKTSEDFERGTLQDWETAGFPLGFASLELGLRLLGVDQWDSSDL